MKNEPRHAARGGDFPRDAIITSSLDRKGQNQEDRDRKLDRKWLGFEPARQRVGWAESSRVELHRGAGPGTNMWHRLMK